MVAAVFLGLAGCDDAITVTPSAQPVSKQTTEGPGKASLSLAASWALFGDVCVDTFPNASKAKAVLAANGFSASAKTGTFYDGMRDASFSLAPRSGKRTCSMVFTSRAKPIDLGLAFALGSQRGPQPAVAVKGTGGQTSAPSAGNSTMTFRPGGVHGGKAYYRAALVANE